MEKVFIDRPHWPDHFSSSSLVLSPPLSDSFLLPLVLTVFYSLQLLAFVPRVHALQCLGCVPSYHSVLFLQITFLPPFHHNLFPMRLPTTIY